MLRHNLEHHPDVDPLCPNYTWEQTVSYTTPMDREVAEAIKIKESILKEGPGHILMNAKTE